MATKDFFIQGAIPSEKLARSVAAHESKTDIGAHSIFLGQVRADRVGDQTVEAIEFSAHVEMAEQEYLAIREEAFDRFDLSCAHIYHSLGRVESGKLCFYVFTSSQRRGMAIEATRYLVEEIKARVPIFGKEIFEDQTHQWKENT